VASLAPTFGRGAMTNTWQDIKNANVVVVMGGNAAEAHPCGFKWVIEAKIENAAKLVVIDPRFTRTASVADLYAPIRPGTDIAFLSGVIRYLLEKDAIQHDYVRAYTNAGLIVKEEYDFVDGLFSGYDAGKRSYDQSTWKFQLDADGYPKKDPTLRDPNCVKLSENSPDEIVRRLGVRMVLPQQAATGRRRPPRRVPACRANRGIWPRKDRARSGPCRCRSLPGAICRGWHRV